jgi:hypothetical protein
VDRVLAYKEAMEVVDRAYKEAEDKEGLPVAG